MIWNDFTARHSSSLELSVAPVLELRTDLLDQLTNLKEGSQALLIGTRFAYNSHDLFPLTPCP